MTALSMWYYLTLLMFFAQQEEVVLNFLVVSLIRKLIKKLFNDSCDLSSHCMQWNFNNMVTLNLIVVIFGM